ncbi:transcriptional regulator [Aneurinibacillus migulanus]|uniref:Response regulator receiver domain-containing protein n=1 Tax=Aneurinibacillus migulanus TaxID=47500 RepID=A0A0D1XAV1_ANEMI|nr:response regulator [Aneurinibacillus migulanus]KIV51516.1 transcriptional regulator [Aneurinibacillus migulanus]KON97587.1 transcriptional regulator [Aneurinibacillus migulanus]KPD05564.1 transcriptional regulator [Aneurinibacillus migulanus]MCP1359051.1 response regulator [Aneurinibacillus migulanus]MED0896736.1 response regulator [Aneurinibacillus migulanus]
MLFYIADDDEAIRSMLAQIIEEEDLGEVAGEADDGSLLDGQVLTLKNIDILLIDLLMPTQDGMETIRQIKPAFKGKIIMISQVESKELIGESYSLGIEYYIVKPINRIEVLAIIRKVIEQIKLEKSIQDIYKSLNTILKLDNFENAQQKSINGKHIRISGHALLSELGIAGENGSKDLLDMLDYLYEYEQEQTLKNGIPPLKEIFLNLAQRRLGKSATDLELKKEIKASEQRVRRAISQSLNHLASLGLTDFSNWKFENYASKFFDFTNVRKKMTELQHSSTSSTSLAGINTKKFIQVLYFEAQRLH